MQKMLRYVLLVSISIMLTACQAKDDQYYRLHPQKLQAALNDCSSTNDSKHCQRLRKIGFEVNQLAYKLQSQPQAFGQKIIALQVELVKLHERYSEKKNDETMKEIEQNQALLEQHLAIVKWLESPES